VGKCVKDGRAIGVDSLLPERKFGGVLDEEMLIALPPSFLPRAVEGLQALSANGLRYPIPNHGIQKSPLDSIQASYGSESV
jgi:hypothetical protein